MNSTGKMNAVLWRQTRATDGNWHFRKADHLSDDHLEWIIPNETEAEILTGVKVTDARSAAKSTEVLKKRGVKHVVITMGSRGCFCGEGSKMFPCKKVNAVDCVAAGDTFNGAFAVALVEGMTDLEAIEFAQKASAISVTRQGAQASIPFRREIR